MTFDFATLEPKIHQILSAPGTDLTTISAKRVRRQLLELDPSLTPEFLKENKDNVDAIIGTVFEKVSAAQGDDGSEGTPEDSSSSRKRKQEEADGELDDVEDSPPPKKIKKAKKNGGQEQADEELARKLSSEINSRSTRAGGKGRGGAKSGRARKSAATVDSDDSDGEGGSSKAKKRSSGGSAKGGFAKEYTLSEPLSAVLEVDKLSRPQVVKQLWVYIKENELQNPSNKREIVCDSRLKAVFGVDKIDMFKMNKVLGDHLHENEG
ncbi:SWIB/MDM2 domain-containing protein [Cyathus striatus]|nr:SWIB/MDM2 domain-containing protein [Cyathus striatus]